MSHRLLTGATWLAIALAIAPAWANPPRESVPSTAVERTTAGEPAREGERSREGGRRHGHARHGPAPVPAGVSVPDWAGLSPDQQRKLAPFEKSWDTMPASRRVRALERLERRDRWEAMTPEQRERLREGARNFRDLPPELREKMRTSMATMRALPEPERKELFRIWRSLDPQQRRTWLEAGGPGISPPPVVPPPQG